MKKYHSINSINRRRRQLQVYRNICMLVVLTIAVVMLSMFIISISTQARDLEHTAEYKYYKSIEIAKGDTLWSIAKENIDTSHYNNVHEYVNEIKAMNAMKSDHIVSGNYIIIPYYSSDFIYSEH